MQTDKTIIGRSDIIDLPDLNLFDIKAKIDSGAYTSAIHCTHIELRQSEQGQTVLHYTLADQAHHQFQTTKFKKKRVKSSFGNLQERYIISTNIILFGKTQHIEFSLSNRGNMRYPILLGRKAIKNHFLIDVAKKNLSYKAKTKGLHL
ncbi:MAG TPA: peptidase [Microscillaceae bacterium]|jgi:hypothetical protein|nr:peptidase [Microscillaceae bacterium]